MKKELAPLGKHLRAVARDPRWTLARIHLKAVELGLVKNELDKSKRS